MFDRGGLLAADMVIYQALGLNQHIHSLLAAERKKGPFSNNGKGLVRVVFHSLGIRCSCFLSGGPSETAIFF